jgi:quaternary ammonium compound-resistance protein SugE
MAWVHIAIAGLLEVAWTVTLKLSNGFSNFIPTAATTAVTLISFYFLSLALKTVPVGTTYAALAGIGAVGTVIAGMMMFGEVYTPIRLFCIALIVGGVVGLRFF